MNKKQRLIATLIAIGLIVGIGGVTFAFFTAGINGNNVSQNASITTTNGLTMTLEDSGQLGFAGVIDPSNLKFTTYLSIESRSQAEQTVVLMFKNLVNTYSDDLVYTLEEVNKIPGENETATVIKTYKDKVPVPKSATQVDRELSTDVVVNPGTTANNGTITANTQYYRVTIEYIYAKNRNQSVDLNASFFTEFTMRDLPVLATNLNKKVNVVQAGTLSAGSTETKTFSVTNTSSYDDYAKISLTNLTNTYSVGEVSYVLSSSDTENGTYTEVGRGTIINTDEGDLLNIEIVDGQLIPSNSTKYYKLEISLDGSATTNVNKIFYTNVEVTTGHATPISNNPNDVTLAKVFKNLTWDENDEANIEIGTSAGYGTIGKVSKDETIQSFINKLEAVNNGQFSGFIFYDNNLKKYLLKNKLNQTMDKSVTIEISFNVIGNRNNKLSSYEFANILNNAEAKEVEKYESVTIVESNAPDKVHLVSVFPNFEWDGNGDTMLKVGTVGNLSNIGWKNKDDDSVQSILASLNTVASGAYAGMITYDSNTKEYSLSDPSNADIFFCSARDESNTVTFGELVNILNNLQATNAPSNVLFNSVKDDIVWNSNNKAYLQVTKDGNLLDLGWYGKTTHTMEMFIRDLEKVTYSGIIKYNVAAGQYTIYNSTGSLMSSEEASAITVKSATSSETVSLQAIVTNANSVYNS